MSEDELFELLRDSPEKRQELFDTHCNDNPELRKRLEDRLKMISSLGEPLPASSSSVSREDITMPASEVKSTQSVGDLPDPSEDIAGTMLVGKYKLLERIGEGGMGSVWLAQQSEPVKRKVAIKLIKAGMDSRAVLARFEAERQALAVMDHPNIAKVLDGGLTPDHRPFFVMELVKGVPITEYCDAKQLTPQERLELFVPVCQAIQHAHQKGIIHRDIKPSNVLIALYDDRPVPKVIDFGVAKAAHGNLSEKTIHTGFGNVVGTPQYMSPEQATFNNLDIDTRSDVYSLGVLLYELLTGSPPFSRRELQEKGLMEILRVVREEEPPKPSTKLSTAEALPTLSANRKTEPKKLTALLKNELDWLVLKALDKDRARRYETANGFAADIQRYLTGEPVQAHPPSRSYRLKKFVRRNRAVVLTSVFVTISLLFGIITATWGFLHAEQKRKEAIDERDKKELALIAESEAKSLADQKRKEAESAKLVAIEQRKLALETVRTVIREIDSRMKNDTELSPLRLSLVQRMLVDLDKIRDQMTKNPLEELTEGTIYHRFGEIYATLNRVEDARTWFLKAVPIFERFTKDDPKSISAWRNLAYLYKDLAFITWQYGNGDESLQHAKKSLDCRNTQIGLLEKSTPRSEEVEIASTQSDVAEAHYLIGFTHLRLGNLAEASQHYWSAQKMLQELSLPYSNHINNQRRRFEILSHLGDIAARQGNFSNAEKLLKQSLLAREEYWDRTSVNNRARQVLRADIALSHVFLGDFYLFHRKKPEAAHRHYRNALEINQELLRLDPKSLQNETTLAAAYYRVGVSSSDPFLAQHAFEQCLKIRRRHANSDPSNMHAQLEVALVYARLGMIEDAEQRIATSLTKSAKDRQVVLQSACVYSIISGVTSDRETSKRCKNRAFEVLAHLLELGWPDIGAIRGDPDLDFIRGDMRFAFVERSGKQKDMYAWLVERNKVESLNPPLVRNRVMFSGYQSEHPESWRKLQTNTPQNVGFLVEKVVGDSSEGIVAAQWFPKGHFNPDKFFQEQQGRFKPNEGSATINVKTGTLKVNETDVTFQEIEGTLIDQPDAKTPATDKPFYRQISVLYQTQSGDTIWFTLQGPTRTVEQHRRGFQQWLESFQPLPKS